MATPNFDDRDGWIWLDGRMVEWRDAKVHILTMRCITRARFSRASALWRPHFKSAEHCAGQRLGPHSILKFPDSRPDRCGQPRRSGETISPTLRASDRLAGLKMMGVSAQHNTIHLGIAVWDWPSYFDPAQRMKGIRLDIADYRRPDPATAPSLAKAAGLYMICTISKHRAERRGYADALMMDWQGRVAECTGANVFFVKDGTIHTPIADCFLAGITRATAIDLARRRGVEVVERRIMPDELEPSANASPSNRSRSDASWRDRPTQPRPAHHRGAHRRSRGGESGLRPPESGRPPPSQSCP
jgi:branched-chain amino acid aminotransferase